MYCIKSLLMLELGAVWSVFSTQFCNAKTIRFGSARVFGAPKEVGGGIDDPEDPNSSQDQIDEDTFNFQFFVPAKSELKAQGDFVKFVAGAGRAYLLASSAPNTLYFAPEGFSYDEEWLTASNICSSEVAVSRLRSNRWQFADLHQILVVHYLCEHYCCGPQCCQMNASLLAIILLTTAVSLSMVIWWVWLNCQCCRVKKPFDVAIARLQGTKAKSHYTVRFKEDLDVVITPAPMTNPKVLSYHSQRVAFC